MCHRYILCIPQCIDNFLLVLKQNLNMFGQNTVGLMPKGEKLRVANTQFRTVVMPCGEQ